MTEDFGKSYRILGVQQGVSWKQLRQAYKKLVNTWHPDRFQEARQKLRAEEKTKEITQSFKRLSEYHKEFGVLPYADSPPEIPGANTVTPTNTTNKPSADVSRAPDHAAVSRPAQTEKPWLSAFPTKIIVVTTLAGITYFLWQFEDSTDYGHLPATTENVIQAVNGSSIENSNLVPAVSNKLITIGSSLGDVYTIQGVPTRSEDDIWYYGKSKIYFSEGKVLRWNEHSENPLRINIIAETEKSRAIIFGKGSSKEEVLAAQGKPDRDYGNVWDYGISRVYFKNERVTRWHDSALNPLHVKR